MKKFCILIMSIYVFMQTSIGYACGPCPKTYTFDQALKASALIVIGQKIKEGPYTAKDAGQGGPDWIEIKIEQVIKGTEQNEVIRVNSWDGMCPFGIVVDDQQNLLLLTRRVSQQEDYQYDAVYVGCATVSYPVHDHKVILNGQLTPLDEILKRISR